jgi:hypothetical protein
VIPTFLPLFLAEKNVANSTFFFPHLGLDFDVGLQEIRYFENTVGQIMDRWLIDVVLVKSST